MYSSRLPSVYAQFMNPTSGWANRYRFGKTVLTSVLLTPNQRARVAEYSSTAMVGIQRPRPVSSGPVMARVGVLPEIGPPLTAPPTTIWWLPQPWSEPPPLVGKVRPKSDV